jgi:BirA family biotin operon repressor/biotin-[acetyl-CoA-carboxylase] ligase
MKGQILKALRAGAGVVSGERLSASLGISRVSIWKHIHKLQELGYHIEATSNGYRLKVSPDVLYPWEFPDREANLVYFPELGSTMDTAKDLARKNCPDFTVVVAGIQTKGRGRLRRVWLSAEGGLYFTMILRPQIHPLQSSRINFLASLTLARTLQDLFDIDAKVKWPNDILVEGKKICGMLSELEAEADQVAFINIGMGINVNNNPEILESKASSIKNIVGREIPRKEILAPFLDEFERRMKKENFDHVISEWKEYSATLNQVVKIVTTHDETEGVAVDVDENGALMVKLEDGTLKTVIYGDCFHTEPSKLSKQTKRS